MNGIQTTTDLTDGATDTHHPIDISANLSWLVLLYLGYSIALQSPYSIYLQRTMLIHFLGMYRLTSVVVFLYVLLACVGTRTIHSGLRALLVDRIDRRGSSIIQLGRRFIEICLMNKHADQVPLCSCR
jgi:hypothetical protein